MSPRFERRPDKRTSSGGKGPARAGRFQPRQGGEGGGRPERRPERAGDDRGARSDFRPDFRRGGERGVGSAGERSFGRRPAGPRPSGDRPYGERSFRDRPSGGRDRSFGDRPSGERSFSDRPFGDRPPRSGRPGDRPAGRRPFGSRPFGAKPFRERNDERPGDRFSRGPAPRGPIVVDAQREQPSGEAERFGVEPSPDLVWGRHAAQAALESGRPIHRIWCTPEMRFSPKFLQLLREAKASGVLVEEVTWARLGQISGGAVHQGIVLQTAAAETLDLPSLIEGCRSLGEPPLLMAVDGLTDPHNLGAIVRSAEALGAHGLVLPQRRNAGLTGTVAKVAAGALENLPVARVVNLNRSLEALKEEGYRVIGLAGEGSVTLEEADLDGPLVVVTGSEGDGLSMLTRRSCDQLVRIPLRGATPSLNASVATALLIYEIARRGWMKGISGSQPAPRISRPAIPNAAPLTADQPEPEPAAGVEAQPQPQPQAQAEEEPAAPVVELGLSPITASGFDGDIQL